MNADARRRVYIFIAVALAYAVGSQLSYSWFGADGTSASFFPAAGVTLAALVIARRADWVVVVAAAALAEITLDLWHDIGLAASAGYAVANVVQPLVGAALLLGVCARPDLSRLRDLVAFLACAVVAGPAVGAVIGATVFTGLDDGSGWLRFAGEWWVGDGLGVLVVAGAILGVRSDPPTSERPLRLVETLALAGAAGAATVAVAWSGEVGLVAVPIGVLLASGFRIGVRGVALTGAVVSFIAAQATAGGHGIWEDLDVTPDTGLIYLQLTLGVLIAAAYGIAAEVGERETSAVERNAALRFRAMADSAPAMLWVTDEQGRCTYLSRGWYAFTGQTEEEGLGSGWLDAVHPEDRDAVAGAHERAVTRWEPFTLDYRLRDAGGRYRWAFDSGRPLLDVRGRPAGFIGSVIDVHDRARTEVALRESEARFRALFESIDEGYCLAEMVLDADGRPVDYRFLETNPIFESMTGLRGAVGHSALELVPDLEREWVDTYAQVALGGEARRFESASEAMGRTFDVFATPVEPRGRFALVFTDVTARRRAEEALRESEAAERRARRRAELLAEIVSGLEAVEGAAERTERLVAMLVPRVADHAAVREPGADPPPGSPTRAHSVVTLPVDVGGPRSARLVLTLTDPARRPYGADDMPFLTDLAGRAGVLLASARIHDEERRVALSLQRALLPEGLLQHPAIEVAARYTAAGDALEVGGDWYETLPLPDGRIGIAVGDVVGHGLDAAATMGRLRTALAALAPHTPAPGALLARLQQFADGPNGTDFATVGFAALDPATGRLDYAYAGHPPMLLLPPGGPPDWLDGGRSMPLCRPGSGRDRGEASTVLPPGAVLLLYTDGLVERRDEPVDVGLRRLCEAADALRDAPVADMCDRVVAAMIRETGNSDDAVLVCLRFRPA